MGKATRWLKGLLGMKKDKENVENFPKFKERKENKRWSFSVSEKHYSESSNIDHSVWLRSLVSETEKEQNKHAIAVAAATAAAADAAAAAAQAAVAVVRLTNQGRLLNGKKEKNAAVKIQAVFRGSLSRKALRALKGLVKLQALVRGYLVRKRAAATLHSMQALFRAQFAVCSQRALLCSNKNNSNHLKYPSSHFRARRSTEKMEGCRSEYHHRRRLSASIEYDASYGGIDEIPSPKIIGIDTCKHKSRSRRIHTCISDDHHHHYPIPCPNSARLSIPNYPQLDECCKKFATAQNTPRFMNCGMSEAPVTTPTKSAGGGGDGYFRRYSNYPSYMANTQSFEAKSRSHSAPKQRVEGIPTRKGLSLNEMMASRLSFSGVRMQRPCLQVEEDFNF